MSPAGLAKPPCKMCAWSQVSPHRLVIRNYRPAQPRRRSKWQPIRRRCWIRLLPRVVPRLKPRLFRNSPFMEDSILQPCLWPGIVSTHANGFAQSNGIDYSSNGLRSRSNNAELDGQANDDLLITGPQIYFLQPGRAAGNSDYLQQLQRPVRPECRQHCQLHHQEPGPTNSTVPALSSIAGHGCLHSPRVKKVLSLAIVRRASAHPPVAPNPMFPHSQKMPTAEL